MTEFEMKDIIEAQSLERRTQFALSVSKFLFWATSLYATVVATAWLLFWRYDQLWIVMTAILPLVASSRLFPILCKRGQVRLGTNLLVIALLIGIAAAPVLPEALPASAIGFAIWVILGNLLLGEEGSRWLIGVGAFVLGTEIIFADRWSPELFEELDRVVSLTLAVVVAVLAFLVVVSIVRAVMVGQETAMRQAQMSSQELERRTATELARREYLQKMVQQYVDFATAVGQGYLNRRLDLPEDGRGPNDPLLLLGHNLNAMTENLQATLLQMHDVAGNISSASMEILAATTQQIASATEQDAAVTQTMATVDEVVMTVRQTAGRARAVADASQQSIAVSRTGTRAVTDTITGMQTIRQRVESIAETILVLSERTQQIGEIIEAVNALADQSKLLALNASIEAARAGEEGKGFAVVAVEVRQLAEQSREATARVSDILYEIQQATNTAVMVTEEGSKGVEGGMGLVERAGEAIQNLATTIEEAAQAAGQIAISTQQQINGMEQLSAAMTAIKQASTQTAASTRQAEHSAQDLTAMAEKLQETVAGYQL